MEVLLHLGKTPLFFFDFHNIIVGLCAPLSDSSSSTRVVTSIPLLPAAPPPPRLAGFSSPGTINAMSSTPGNRFRKSVIFVTAASREHTKEAAAKKNAHLQKCPKG